MTDRRDFVSVHHRSFALVLTVLLVTLLVATGAGVALTAMTESTAAGWAARDLEHRLALDSLLVCLPALMQSESAGTSNGKIESRRRYYELSVGRCDIRSSTQSEKHKLQISKASGSVADRLQELAREHKLLAANIRSAPIVAIEDAAVPRYVWFDQLVEPTEFEEVFWRRPLDEVSRLDQKTWADLVSFWGGQTGESYSVDVETRIGHDARRWYLIVLIVNGKAKVVYECSV